MSGGLLTPAKQGFVGASSPERCLPSFCLVKHPLMDFTPSTMQKALHPDRSWSGFSPQPRQNIVLTGVGRKKAVAAIGLPEVAEDGTSVSRPRQGLGREIEVTAPRHRSSPGQAPVAILIPIPRQGLGMGIEMTTARHRHSLIRHGAVSSLSGQNTVLAGERRRERPQKKTPEDVCMHTPEKEKTKPIKQRSLALRIRETAQQFCESSEPPPVGPLCSPQARVGYWALSVPSGAQGQQGWRRSRLDLSL